MGRPRGVRSLCLNRNARIDPARVWTLAIAGLRGVEIARVLGCSPAYVCKKLRPIRGLLRLQRAGLDLFC